MPFGIVSESIKHKQRKKNVSPTYKEMFFYSFDLFNRITTWTDGQFAGRSDKKSGKLRKSCQLTSPEEHLGSRI